MGELVGLYALWLRELKVYFRERSRIVSSLATPLLWLIVFGGGLGASVNIEGVNYQEFIYPGILCMSVIFSSIFFGMYIIWDRKMDFLKEVLAAPLNRTTIFLGKVLGGSTDALIQSSILLGLGVFFGIQYSLYTILTALLFLLLLASAMTSIGLIFGSIMKSPEGFSLIISLVIFPLFFLSGALFPIDHLPSWLAPFILVDPVTYAVDGLRGLTLNQGHFPILTDLGVLASFTGALLIFGSYAFRRMEV